MAAWSVTVALLVCLTFPEPVRPLSEAEKEDVVHAHNNYRSEVPDATSMLRMNWDNDLAEMAAEYAQKCVWGHNKERGPTGENLYVVTSPLDLKEAVKKWYSEFTDYTYETMDCTPQKMCGHYTQVIWANSNKVGCSSHSCDEVKGLEYKNMSLLVCNYLPPGNVVGQHPYKKGTPCSECPDGTKCIENLCTSEQEPETQSEPKLEAEPKSEPVTGPETKLEPVTEPETKLEPITEPEKKLEPITEPEKKLEPITEPEKKTEPKMELETASKPEPKLQLERNSKLSQETEFKLGQQSKNFPQALKYLGMYQSII
ncbi:peptidase inhibitor 16-like isoform X2 [Scyliorhinus canicula]|uniref:peptidase inhibitor 16-like isoform X2 n=1 Tax=Scyliorhinus canicula TaxID=7830 RepID=UPI0018F4B4AF|nr:peptidase inhibitor 16-like isoform X2 [Scyliorhinus canicula]